MTMKVLFSRQSLFTNVALMKHPYTFAIEHRMNLFSELSIIYKTHNMNGYNGLFGRKVVFRECDGVFGGRKGVFGGVMGNSFNLGVPCQEYVSKMSK